MNTVPQKVIDETPPGEPAATASPAADVEMNSVDKSIEKASRWSNWLVGIVGAAAGVFVFGASSMRVAAKLMTKEDYEAQMQRRDARIAAEIKPLKEDIATLKEDRAVFKNDVTWLKQSNGRLEGKLDQLLELGGIAQPIRRSRTR